MGLASIQNLQSVSQQGTEQPKKSTWGFAPISQQLPTLLESWLPEFRKARNWKFCLFPEIITLQISEQIFHYYYSTFFLDMGQAATFVPALSKLLFTGPSGFVLLGLRLRIPPGAWMSVYCELCVLSGRGLCDGPITRPEESYRVCCVWVWSRNLIEEASTNEGCPAMIRYIYIYIMIVWMVWFLLCV